MAMGFGDRQARVFDGLPDIADVQKWFVGQSPEAVRHRLRSITLQLHGEANPTKTSAVSWPVTIRNWLAFELRDGAQRYCLHNGAWYRMDTRNLERVDQRTDDILSQPASISLPAWVPGETEGDYNIRAAGVIGGYLLDKKMIHTPLHPRGIESCDIFVPPGILIHVKRADKSASISHLLAQALVSAEALAHDEFAREAWMKKIESVSGGAVSHATATEVVLAIAGAKPVTTNTLFTFSKVNLIRQYDLLRNLGVNVRVVSISI
ncbi:DUF6119 family protein [Nocardia sp. 2YAB30]|uniref:DUF6119 family protein n=2 Tax=unclassified Nocardia TaxID=2637762 RepID=UPI003F962EF2